MRQSKWEAEFAFALEAVGCFDMVRQHRFDPARKWAFDFAHVATRIAVEIDGGEFVQGAHNRGVRMAKDYEKRNNAILQGWVVFQLTGQMVKKDCLYWAVKVKERVMATEEASLPRPDVVE